MNLFIRILGGTPWWVWALLLILVWLGLQAARPRVVRLQRIFVIPAIFIFWGLVSLTMRPMFSETIALDWAAAALGGAALGMLTTRVEGLQVDRRLGLVELPGSWRPLARFLAIFLIKYVLAVAIALRPDLRGELTLCDVAVSGALTGYFGAWAFVFLRSYLGAANAGQHALTLRVGANTEAS
jgi:hypothetical protein